MDWLWSIVPAGALAAAATFMTATLTATGRPGATLFLLFAVPETLVYSGVWEVGDWFFPPAHQGLLIGLGIWAVVEHFLRGELYGELLRVLPLDSIGAVLLLWLVFVGQVAVGQIPEGTAPDVVHGFRQVVPIGPALVLLAIAIPLQLAVGWARNRVFEVVRDMGFAGSLAVFEFFGVAGLVVGVVLVPTAALVLTVLVVVPLVVAATVSRIIDLRQDQLRRRPCPSCGQPVREEASRCPYCRVALPVIRPLDPAVRTT